MTFEKKIKAIDKILEIPVYTSGKNYLEKDQVLKS